jgi:predicted RNA-binding protein with PIN domain
MARSSSDAFLYVDGYNMIGCWPDLLETRDRHGLEAARNKLIEALVGFSAYQGYVTEIVFDAHYQTTPENREIITKNLSAHYTAYQQSADTYIELICARFRNQIERFNHRLIVATSDRTQQSVVSGYGAEWMSAQRLHSEVESATQRIRRQQKTNGRSRHRGLFHSLDSKAQQQLTRMRFGTTGKL